MKQGSLLKTLTQTQALSSNCFCLLSSKTKSATWAAANGGVTNGGLRGVWLPFPEIGRNRPFSPFFCLFRPFPEGAKSTWEIQKTEEKGLSPQISSDLLKPPSLKTPVCGTPRQRAQLLSFGVRRPPGWVGIFHGKGWQLKSSFPPSKVRSLPSKSRAPIPHPLFLTGEVLGEKL